MPMIGTWRTPLQCFAHAGPLLTNANVEPNAFLGTLACWDAAPALDFQFYVFQDASGCAGAALIVCGIDPVGARDDCHRFVRESTQLERYRCHCRRLSGRTRFGMAIA